MNSSVYQRLLYNNTYLDEVDVPALLHLLYSCEEKVSLFEKNNKTGSDIVVSLRSTTIQLK